MPLIRVTFYAFSTLAILIGGKLLGLSNCVCATLFTYLTRLSTIVRVLFPMKYFVCSLAYDRIEETGAVGVSGPMAGLVPSPYFQRYRCLLRLKRAGAYDEDAAAGYSESETSETEPNGPSDPNDPNADASSMGAPSSLGMWSSSNSASISGTDGQGLEAPGSSADNSCVAEFF